MGKNEGHDKRPRTSLTNDNIRCLSSSIQKLIEHDRQFTTEGISSEVGISYGSVQFVITDYLDFRKISARWVPRLLIGNHKQIRSEIALR